MFRRRSSEAGKNEAAAAGRHHGPAPAGHSTDHGAGRSTDHGAGRSTDHGAGHRPGPEAGDPGHQQDGRPQDGRQQDGHRQDGPWGRPPAGLDVSLPHPARVRNYWLGGRDFYAADKAAGEEIGREFPHLAAAARAERAFLVRAVRFLAGPARIRQFLDVGSGLPAGGNTHEIAQGIAPDARIVYADHDPAVILHAKTLLGNPMLASTREGAAYYADADLRDVAAVLAAASTTLDPSRPVALIMAGVLGHIDDFGAARSITSQLMSELPAGSYLVLADGVADSDAAVSAQRRYDASARSRYGASAPAPYRLRRPDELTSFFAGLDLTEPGVVPCPQWRPDGRGAGLPGGPDDAGTAAYCGVARKPNNESSF